MDKKNAIETIKSFIDNTDNVIVKDALLELHPEYAESEDERIRKMLLNMCDDWEHSTPCRVDKCNVPGVRAWLEKQKEQQRVEWSGEDKEMLDAMIDIVSNSLYEPLCPREGMLAWLKFLPERFNLHPHWKPSKEQMRCLEFAIRQLERNYLIGPGRAEDKGLYQLVNDLKSL